jgi:hypothetical protein
VIDIQAEITPTVEGGQPGLWGNTVNGPINAIQLDDFEASDAPANPGIATGVMGEGVWVHDRGAGVVEFLTSDSGAVFVPPVSVTLTVNVEDSSGAAVEGASVRIEASSDGSLIAQGTTNVSGVFSAAFAYTGDIGVLTKVRLKGFRNFRTGGTIESTGITVGVTLQDDNIVDLP